MYKSKRKKNMIYRFYHCIERGNLVGILMSPLDTVKFSFLSEARRLTLKREDH